MGLLRQAGAGGGDAFNHIASQWLGSGEGLQAVHLPGGLSPCKASAASPCCCRLSNRPRPLLLLSAPPAGSPERVSKADREKAKKVTYGKSKEGPVKQSVSQCREGSGHRGLLRLIYLAPGANQRSPPWLATSAPTQPAGIIYGLTAYGLAQGSGALGISVQAGQVRLRVPAGMSPRAELRC